MSPVVARPDRAAPGVPGARGPGSEPGAGALRRRDARLPLGALGLFLLGYAAQAAGVLRLNADVVDYLGMAASGADGGGFNPGGLRYPIGYPVLVAGLDRLGLPVPVAFVGLNAMLLAVGLFIAYGLYRQTFGYTARRAATLCLLVCASFVMVKHAALAMPDVLFSIAAVATVGAAVSSRERRGWGRFFWFVLAAGLAAAALSLRTAGVALLPVLFFGLLPRAFSPGGLVAGLRRRPAVAVGVALLVVGVLAGGAVVLVQTTYGKEGLALFDRYGTGGVALWNVRAKVGEWGELVLNVPLLFPSTLLGWQSGAVYVVAGAAGMLAVLRGLWLRRRAFGPVEVFVIAYSLMLVLWPAQDARLWLPVFPFLVAYMSEAALDAARTPWRRRALAVYAGGYVLA
ncbi:MAG TPA: hypothetical protein VK610_00965, partial [Rhodothermales bacterium]|nr:hypothetical protein [Rhodothermales bacterium]